VSACWIGIDSGRELGGWWNWGARLPVDRHGTLYICGALWEVMWGIVRFGEWGVT